MSSDFTSFPLIQSKLHQPNLPVDLIHRPQLTEWLDARRNRPVTLVSAPAGYGKSTLISSWLDHCNYPSTWLTLDARDNDLAEFLTYFLAAIRVIYPEAAKKNTSFIDIKLPGTPQRVGHQPCK